MSEKYPKNVVATSPKLIAVEGRDDQSFFESLARHLNLQGIQVVAMEGKFPLKDKIASIKLIPNFGNIVTSLGIVIDADGDWAATFDSLKGALSDAGFAIPESCLVTAEGSPSVTIMLLPCANSPGMLEDLCLMAVNSKPVMECLNRYFKCLSAKGVAQDNPSKAKVHAFLASLKEPDLRLGHAACKGYLPFDDAAFAEAKTFLQAI